MAATETPTHGNFIAFLARDKEPGDKRPVFEGRLSLPDVEGELHFPLWGHEYADPKTGEMMTMFTATPMPYRLTMHPRIRWLRC